MSYQIGDRIGDYQIVDVLGAGGMGKVYKVRNVISERVEAMKVLLPNLESDPDLADRFMREIKVQASLQHPNIATLHTAQRINNQLIMLIEFVEGTTLEAELRKGPVAVPKALDYIRQVLLALSYAHGHGIVHRDIKPANMMLTPSGQVKLMDFGIARLSADRRLTQTGRTLGSLYYMSPEQIQGAQSLDARSDLYSLGVSLYELVTNRRPFQGDSDYSIMAAHLSANPVPPVEIDRSLPSILNDVILMAIEKDPVRRFQTADAFRAALESVAANLMGAARPVAPMGPVAPPPQPVNAGMAAPPPPVAVAPGPPPGQGSSRRGLYIAAGSVLTLLVLGLAAWQGPKFFGSAASTNPPRETSTTQAGLGQQPAESPGSNPAVAGNSQGQVPVAGTTTVDVPVGTQTRNNLPPVTPRGGSQVSTAVSGAASRADDAAPVNMPPANYASQAGNPPAQQQQSSGPVPQAAVTTSPDPAREEELRAGRELLMLLGTRANSTKASLGSIKQQQARMGTNLRGDIQTAEQRMEFYLDDAEAAIKAGDPARAKKSLESAERAIEVIEKFLGR